MNNFFQFLLHFIFIATFLFVYIIAIIILKPFRLHRKRKISKHRDNDTTQVQKEKRDF